MCCEKEFRPLRLVIACVTFIVSVFDVSVDWYTFSQFVNYQNSELDPTLTIALGILCGVGSVIFIFEVRNAIHAYRTYTSQSDDVSDAERSLERWQEIITFFQLVLEDCPITVIMFLAYRWGSCTLFLRLFEDSFTGNLALLAAFVSAVWKVLVSLCYCLCGCCVGAAKDCGWDCCCCCCRALRTIVALALLAFAAFLFFTFNGRGISVREDC